MLYLREISTDITVTTISNDVIAYKKGETFLDFISKICICKTKFVHYKRQDMVCPHRTRNIERDQTGAGADLELKWIIKIIILNCFNIFAPIFLWCPLHTDDLVVYDIVREKEIRMALFGLLE